MALVAAGENDEVTEARIPPRTRPPAVARRVDRSTTWWRRLGPVAVPLGLLTAMQWSGTLASPALYDQAPLALVFLSPRTPFLLYASVRSPVVLFVVVAAVRLLLADPLNYSLGRRFGPGIADRFRRRGRRTARLVAASERVLDRCGVLAVGLRPNAMMLALAGARGLPPVATAVAATTGTVAYVLLLVLTAGAVDDPVRALWGWAGERAGIA